VGDHTTDSNGTDTAYFPAGTGGYASGHFVCLHGHCRGRDGFEFEKELGLVDNEFDDFEYPADADVPVPSLVLRRQLKMNDNGTLPTVGNLELVLEQARLCGWHIQHDSFREAIMIAPVEDPSGWRELVDTDYVNICIGLEATGFLPIGRQTIRDVLALIAMRNSFDSAQLWLNDLEWDGVPRVKSFCEQYLKCAAGPYADAVSEYIWSALAGRVLRPGAKADMMPVLVGSQGVGKSTAVEAMVPDSIFYGKVNLAERDTDLSRKMRGKLIMEVAELRGLQTRDNESIKDFISQTHEEWTPKWKEFATKYARRFLFIGTTNQVEFLADPTGERRWLPLKVLGAVDVVAIERDCLQLWAEGVALFKQQGILWAEAERLAKPVHEEHRVGDLFTELVENWLCAAQDPDGSTPMSKGHVTTHEVLVHALGHDVRQIRKGDEMRVAAVLRGLGYERHTDRGSDKIKKIWVKTPAI
jgi:predicted P-loop ATPase